jgi:crossover junction endodeoxyribonuclease RuvC
VSSENPEAPRLVLLAVDPGLSNGLAVLDQQADLLFATTVAPIGEGARKRLPLAGLVDLIERYGVTHAVVEDVGAMPKQGITSAFRFGRATGSFEGVLSALKIPTEFIRPAIWKKRFGTAGATKEGARCLAMQRWPASAHFFLRKKCHNLAEAALLGAYYVERHRSDVLAEVPRFVPVMSDGTCAGFLINRGPRGIEGFDCNEKSIGIFNTPIDAANAVQRAAGGNHERGGAS